MKHTIIFVFIILASSCSKTNNNSGLLKSKMFLNKNRVFSVYEFPKFLSSHQNLKIQFDEPKLIYKDSIIEEYNINAFPPIKYFHNIKHKIDYQGSRDYFMINNNKILYDSLVYESDSCYFYTDCILNKTGNIQLNSSIFKIVYLSDNFNYGDAILITFEITKNNEVFYYIHGYDKCISGFNFGDFDKDNNLEYSKIIYGNSNDTIIFFKLGKGKIKRIDSVNLLITPIPQNFGDAYFFNKRQRNWFE